MRKSFDNLVQKSNEYSMLLEDVLNNLPDSAKNYKLKKKVESAHKAFKRSMERHELLITDTVPPIKVKTDDYPKDFIDIWSVYKDFLTEQFGIRMGSRMQVYRLSLLFELADKDFTKATNWLKYYMAAGSSSIYPVNELKIEEKNGEKKEKKAGFTLPKSSNGTRESTPASS